jgi:hypothetical protein
MKKLFFLLFAMILTAGALTSCGNGADKKAADTTVVKKDTLVVPVDTTKMDTGKPRPIVPPPSTKQ